MDLAIGDFDGDLRNDVFAARGSFGKAVTDTVDIRTLHARYMALPGSEGMLSFLAEGDLLIDFDWSTKVGTVFLGGAGVNPPASADLSVYNGWNNHVQIKLSDADPENHGIGLGSTGGIYAGYVDGRWMIRFVADEIQGHPQITVQADLSISDLMSDGSIDVGQAAGARPVLVLQDETGGLVDSSERLSGPQSSCTSASAGDFDNDGDLDVFVGCSGVIKNLDNILYTNDGLGNFSAVTGDLLGDAKGDIFGRTDAVLTADYDQDGRLDLFVTNGQPFRPFSYAARQQLFRNETANDNHWVELDLIGRQSNRNGIGARVFAYTPDGEVQLREQANGMHRDAQDFRRLHFGLGSNSRVDLQVRWPSGVVDNFYGVTGDRIHVLVEGTGSIQFVRPCGPPAYDPANDSGLYIWEESCGNSTRTFAVAAMAGNGVDPVKYRGQVDSDQAFGSVSPWTMEAEDSLDTLKEGEQIKYAMRLRAPGQDGFRFDIPAEASVCFSGDLPAGTKVLVGPDKTEVQVPFDLITFAPCVPRPVVEFCGAPVYDPETEFGLHLWEEDCGGVTRRFSVRGTAGGIDGSATIQGQVDADQPFTSVVPFRVEAEDTLDVSSDALQIQYGMNLKAPWYDGFDFSTESVTNLCFGAILPVGAKVLVGPQKIEIQVPFDLTNFEPCMLDSDNFKGIPLHTSINP